jgi:hypothetical protein
MGVKLGLCEVRIWIEGGWEKSSEKDIRTQG